MHRKNVRAFFAGLNANFKEFSTAKKIVEQVNELLSTELKKMEISACDKNLHTRTEFKDEHAFKFRLADALRTYLTDDAYSRYQHLKNTDKIVIRTHVANGILEAIKLQTDNLSKLSVKHTLAGEEVIYNHLEITLPDRLCQQDTFNLDLFLTIQSVFQQLSHPVSDLSVVYNNL